jgi:type I restriction enzyme S subunit
MVQLRRVSRFGYGDSLADRFREEGSVPVYGSNGQVGTHGKPNTDGPTVVIGRKGSFGKVQYSNVPVFAIDTTFYVDQRMTRSNMRWLFYLLQTLNLDALSEDVGVPGLSREKAYEQRVPFPPPDTQRAIGDYLDRETARIDALIAAKRRMVALLEERLQGAVSKITHARSVADPAHRLPDGWKLVPLKRCLRSSVYGIGEASQPEGDYAVLGMTNVSSGEIVGTPGGFVSVVDNDLLLAPGDLLFNRTNSRELVGKVGLVRALDRPTTFASYLVRLRVNKLADAHYMNYLLNAREVLGLARNMALPSIGQANLNPTRYAAMVLPIPPVDEQRRLVSRLNALASRTADMKRLLERQVILIDEHRQALITAAVTGQLDMPEAA